MVAVAALATAGPAAPAGAAGDPVMPLNEVQRGLECTAYSVVQGTAIDSFQAKVIEVVDDPGGGGARILVEVSGPAIDRTGVGPGFSGSPIYCGGRVIGAISETIGEYGGKTVLATPIEQILGESPDPPAEAAKPLPRALAASRRTIAAPLSVSGLSPALGRALAAAARKQGRIVLAAPGRTEAALPAPAATARLRVRGRLLDRRPVGRRDRHGRLRRRRQAVGLRPRVRGRRPPVAAAAGRLRLPRGLKPPANGRDLDLQAGRQRPRRRDHLQRCARRRGGTVGGAAEHDPGPPDAQGRRHRSRQADARQRCRRGRPRPADGRLAAELRRAAGADAGARPSCCAAARRG